MAPQLSQCITWQKYTIDEKAMVMNRNDRISYLALDTKWERNTHIWDNIK